MITYTEWLTAFKETCINAGLKIDKVEDDEHTPFVDAWLNRKNPQKEADIFIRKVREDEEKKEEIRNK